MLNDRRPSETDGGLADYTSNEKKTVAVVAEVAIEISRREVALRSQALWGGGIRQMTENRLELLTKKEAAQSRLSLHL